MKILILSLVIILTSKSCFKRQSNITTVLTPSDLLLNQKTSTSGLKLQERKPKSEVEQNGSNVTLSWYVVDKTQFSSYDVSKDDGVNWIGANNSLSYTFTNLVLGRTYKFQVRGKNNKGSNVVILKTTKNLLSYNVRRVILGGHHSSIKTTSNRLFVFGNNKYGQLGLGDKKNRNTPVELIDANVKGKIKRVTLRNYHSFIETTDNKLFVFGKNYCTQLGFGLARVDYSSPAELANKNIKGKVKKVTLGNCHSAIETTEDKLFVFGDNRYGQLGLGSSKDDYFTLVELTDTNIKDKVKKVTLGATHSFIETTNKLFVFGDNYHGQLGLGNRYIKSTPVELSDANIKGKVKKITLGDNYSFIETTEDKLFVFGSNDFGELGLGFTKCSKPVSTDPYSCPTPQELTDKNIKGKVKKVTLGRNHSFIETTDNKLFVFGDNYYGQLGLGDTKNRDKPVELSDANIKGKVKKVILGATHSFIETTDNKLFVFGDNRFGQLGLGDTKNRNTPVEFDFTQLK